MPRWLAQYLIQALSLSVCKVRAWPSFSGLNSVIRHVRICDTPTVNVYYTIPVKSEWDHVGQNTLSNIKRYLRLIVFKLVVNIHDISSDSLAESWSSKLSSACIYNHFSLPWTRSTVFRKLFLLVCCQAYSSCLQLLCMIYITLFILTRVLSYKRTCCLSIEL